MMPRRLLVLALFSFVLAGCPAEEADDTENANMGSFDAGDAGDGEDGGEATLDLRRVDPAAGNIAGGITTTLSGSGFVDGATVTFDESEATSVTFIDSSTLRAEVPAGDEEGAVPVTVTNPDGSSDTIANGFTYTTMEDPTVGYCRLQAQSPVGATTGTPTSGIFAIVFTDGITQGEGQGAMIEGQLGYGMGIDYENFDYVPMTYNTDVDGLNAGDLANDEYGAELTIQSAGTYRYAARFRLTSSPDTWVYCDLDGSDNGVDPDQLGVIEVTDPATPEVDYCEIAGPATLNVETGETTQPVGVAVFSAGATEGEGQASSLIGELGFGTPSDAVEDFAFRAMTYAGDVDGLANGDLANDLYEGRFDVAVPGDYRYAARFRVDSEPDGWVYCDLDGSENGIDGAQLGVLTVEDPAVPTITYCETRPANANAVTGDSVDYEGLVFAAGVTNSAGDGGATSELWWGPTGTDPSTWSSSTTGAYDRDEDGLNPADVANDVHTATLTAPAAGDYDVAFRFSIDGGTTWSWCDGDGSDGTASGYVVDEAANLAVASANLPDACNIQFPVLADRTVSGESVTFYGRVTEPGVTGTGSAPANVQGDLLVGPAGTDPVTDLASFTVVPGSYFANATGTGPNEDEFSASWTVGAPGDYDFLWRFSVDGGQNYKLCDIDGNDGSTGFEADKVGRVISASAANPPDRIDFCHVFQTNLSYSLTSGGIIPVATVEVFEAGVTENNMGANAAAIEVQAGWGADGTNPAVAGAYAWDFIPYARVRPGFVNNYEYEGPVFPMNAAPSQGSYDVVARARLAGTQDPWVYCDTDDGTADFRLDATTTLLVSP